MRILDRAKISYSFAEYAAPDGAVDGVTVAEKIGENPDFVYKTLVTKGQGGYFVFVVPVKCELDLKAAARAVGQKSVEMIKVADINKVTGYIRGGCSPVGMKKQFVTVADASAENLDYFFVSGGKIGLQIKVNPKDIASLTGMTFAPIVK